MTSGIKQAAKRRAMTEAVEIQAAAIDATSADTDGHDAEQVPAEILTDGPLAGEYDLQVITVGDLNDADLLKVAVQVGIQPSVIDALSPPAVRAEVAARLEMAE